MLPWAKSRSERRRDALFLVNLLCRSVPGIKVGVELGVDLGVQHGLDVEQGGKSVLYLVEFPCLLPGRATATRNLEHEQA